MKVAEDADVLKSVLFDNVRLSGRYGLFQEANGLLSRCARAGNVTALYMLSKVTSLGTIIFHVKCYALEA